MAYAFSLTKDTTNIYVKVTGITSSYRYIQAAYRKSSASSLSYTDYKYVSGSSTTITISDLSPGTQYVVNVRYSADGKGTGTFIGSQTIVTDEEELIEPIISGYSFSGTTLILEFDDLSDCPYISVLYRKSGASSNKETGYTKLTSRSNEIEITGLELGVTYVISYRYSTDGSTQEGTVSYGSISMPDPIVPYISSYNVSGNTITLYFSDLSDYKYINVVYRKSSASTSESTGYTRLTSSNNSVTLSNLEYGSTYVISYRYSADGITQEDIVSYGSISIPALAVPQATASVYLNTITLTFTNFHDCPYVSVLYRPSDASSNENTAYMQLTSSDPTVSLTDLLYGTTYVISYRYSIDGYTQQGIVSFGSVYITPIASDEQLVANCSARWRNNYYVGSGSWSSNAIGVTVEFNSTYPFCDKYFQSVALMYDFAGTGGGYFTTPSTSKPDDRYVIADSIKTPTSTESSSVTIYLSGSFETEDGSSYSIGNGGHLRLSAYVQTINGTYIPIPASKQFKEYDSFPKDNEYQFYVWTKPSNVSYTAANVPEKDKAVNLLASDIRTFLHTLDICCLWLFDEKKTGIDDEDVKSGKPICASHFSAMYDAIVECLKKKTFTNSFSKVSAGDDIVAENLLNLPATINNLLNVV